MTLAQLKNKINHVIQTVKSKTDITGYSLNVIINDIVSFFDTRLSLIETEPLIYEAILNQNAPVAPTNAPFMKAGQIWELVTHDEVDDAKMIEYVDAGYLELVSGTINVVGSKYRSPEDFNFAFLVYTFTNTWKYDGAPYVVSKDVNGNFNPILNSLGITPTYTYNIPGSFNCTSVGSFTDGKTIVEYKPSLITIAILEGNGSVLNTESMHAYAYDEDSVQIYTYDALGQCVNGILRDGYFWIRITVGK